MRELNLPAWAELISAGKVKIKARDFYPEILAEIKPKKEELDQYWLAMAVAFAKLDVQFAIAGTSAIPPNGSALTIIIEDDVFVDDDPEKGKLYAQHRYPAGMMKTITTSGVKFGNLAREYYKRVRQFPSI